MPSASTYQAIMGYGTAWGVGTETTYGTAVAPTSNAFIPFISESTKATYALFDVKNSRMRFTQKTLNRGRKSVSGDVNFHVEPETIGWPLFYMFGSAGTPATTDTSAYTHTFTPQDDVKSFTSQFRFGSAASARAKQVDGCKITGLQFEFGEDVVTATATMAARDIKDIATGDTPPSTAPSYSANMQRVFTFRDCKIAINAANGGTAYDTMQANVVSGSISINAEHYTEDFRQGNDTIGSMPTGYFSYEGSLEIVYSYDSTLEAWFTDANTARDVVISWEGELAGAATAKYKLEITMPATFVTEATPAMSAGERISRSVSFKGFHDEAQSTKNIKVVLVNKHSTAYA